MSLCVKVFVCICVFGFISGCVPVCISVSVSVGLSIYYFIYLFKDTQKINKVKVIFAKARVKTTVENSRSGGHFPLGNQMGLKH